MTEGGFLKDGNTPTAPSQTNPMPITSGHKELEVSYSDIVTASGTAQVLVPANIDRKKVIITNNSNNQAVFIRLKPAVEDPSLAEHICLRPVGNPHILQNSGEGMYHGEISVIAPSGSPQVSVVELS